MSDISTPVAAPAAAPIAAVAGDAGPAQPAPAAAAPAAAAAAAPSPVAAAAPAPDLVTLTRADLDALLDGVTERARAAIGASAPAVAVVVRKTATELPQVGDVVDYDGEKALVLDVTSRPVKDGEDPQYVVRVGRFVQTYTVDAEKVTATS